MPKYDAFGREVGEDTLAEQGWRAESAAPVAQPVHSHEHLTPDLQAPQVEAPQLEAPQVEIPRVHLENVPPPAVAVRRPPLRALRWLIILAVMGVVGYNVLGGAFDELDEVVDDINRAIPTAAPGSVPPPIQPAAPESPAPVGLQPGSLIRRQELAAAIDRLRAARLGRVSHLSVRPDRVDAQLLDSEGYLINTQIRPGPALRTLSRSGPGFDSARTISFESIRAGGAERLARVAARRLGISTNRIDYLVLMRLQEPSWVVYFKNGRYVIGDAAGNFGRAYP